MLYYYSLYFLIPLILLQLTVHSARTKSLNDGQKSLDQLYEDFKSSQGSCSLNTPDTEKHFQELCNGKKSPDPNNIEEKKFLFDFIPYLCYTVLHNLKSACRHTEQNFTKFQSVTDPSKFCTEMPAIEIQEKNCSLWLEDQQKAEADCALVSKVVGVILSNKTCHDNCIKDENIDPLCQDLVESSLILANLSNKFNQIQPTVSHPQSPPGLTTTTEQTKQKDNETNKNEEETKTTKTTEEDKTPLVDESSSVSVSLIPTATEDKDKNSKKKNENGKNVKNEKIESEDIKEDKSKGNIESKDKTEDELKEEEEEDDDEEEIDNNASTETLVTVKDPPVEASEPEEQQYSGGISSETNSEGQSNFFSYFILLSIVAILAYLVFHNKQKILALILEGRRHQGPRRRHGGREYRKIDSSLEDTMDAGREADLRQVIY